MKKLNQEDKNFLHSLKEKMEQHFDEKTKIIRDKQFIFDQAELDKLTQAMNKSSSSK